jgi:hypothetical protein
MKTGNSSRFLTLLPPTQELYNFLVGKLATMAWARDSIKDAIITESVGRNSMTRLMALNRDKDVNAAEMNSIRKLALALRAMDPSVHDLA